MKKRIIHYQDELNDDFAKTKIEAKNLPNNFKHVKTNPFYKVGAFIVYYIIAVPVAWISMKITYLTKIKNKKVVKKVKETGYFIYGNHTGSISDAFQPNILRLFKRNYVVVGPETLSINGIKNLVTMLGAIPLGETFEEKIGFLNGVKTRIKQKASVTIYPEQHIWPFYTKIRPFNADSFRFPVSLDVPAFALTTTYHKRTGLFALSKRPKIITYVDGPFYPDKNLKPQEARQKIRDEVYEAMVKRANQVPQYEYVQYIKTETKTDN